MDPLVYLVLQELEVIVVLLVRKVIVAAVVASKNCSKMVDVI
jgi:hypothetical protein